MSNQLGQDWQQQSRGFHMTELRESSKAWPSGFPLSTQQVGGGWGLRICIFNEFPADADVPASGPWPHRESLCGGGWALRTKTACVQIVTLQLTGLMASGEGLLLPMCFLSGH